MIEGRKTCAFLCAALSFRKREWRKPSETTQPCTWLKLSAWGVPLLLSWYRGLSILVLKVVHLPSLCVCLLGFYCMILYDYRIKFVGYLPGLYDVSLPDQSPQNANQESCWAPLAAGFGDVASKKPTTVFVQGNHMKPFIHTFHRSISESQVCQEIAWHRCRVHASTVPLAYVHLSCWWTFWTREGNADLICRSLDQENRSRF